MSQVLQETKSMIWTKGHPKSKLLYFSVNPEGEAEIVTVNLTAGCSAKIKQFDFNFAEIEIKGRSSEENIVTKYPVRKVALKEKGASRLAHKMFGMTRVLENSIQKKEENF